MVICLEQGTDILHRVQLMPQLPIISCFIEIENGLHFYCWLTMVVLEKRLLNECFYCLLRKVKNVTVITTTASTITAVTVFMSFLLWSYGRLGQVYQKEDDKIIEAHFVLDFCTGWMSMLLHSQCEVNSIQ